MSTVATLLPFAYDNRVLSGATHPKKRVIQVEYDEVLPGVVSRISGHLDTDDIQAWSESVLACIEHRIPGQQFKFFLDSRGLSFASIDALREFSHSLNSGGPIRDFCGAIAAVHNDGYFTNASVARRWLQAVRLTVDHTN